MVAMGTIPILNEHHFLSIVNISENIKTKTKKSKTLTLKKSRKMVQSAFKNCFYQLVLFSAFFFILTF